MLATDVYNIAKALPPEEQAKLYNMLKSHLLPKSKTKAQKYRTPEFTDENALEYLLNHLKIINQ